MDTEHTDTAQSSHAPSERRETWAWRTLLAAVILAPLAFVPMVGTALDLVKVCLIVLCVVVSAVLYASLALRDRSISLPPRMIAWASLAVVISIIASALAVHPIAVSFFGQGFELDTAAFIAMLFVALGLVYKALSHKPERLISLYAASLASFFILELFHILRFIFGPGFASLGILSSLTLTVLGSWYALASYALFACVIIVAALTFLALPRRMKIVSCIAALAAFATAFLVNDVRAWAVAAFAFLGIALYAAFIRPAREGSQARRILSRIAWIPLVACLVSALFVWKGNDIAGPAITAASAGYSEVRLPWQMTLDVGAGEFKTHPLLGAGPNRFTEAYIANKPSSVNLTDAWGIEFTSGLGMIPTFFITQGILGMAAWITFFVFLGILIVRALRKSPHNPGTRFLIASSSISSVFLWVMLCISVQPIALVLLAFVMTGAFLGVAVSSGFLSGWDISFGAGRSRKVLSSLVLVFVILMVLCAVVYAKNAVALSYFNVGLNNLNVSNDPAAADADFRVALALHDSDVFWQARAEASIAAAQKVISSVSSASDASTTSAAATQAAALINQGLGHAQRAVAYDPTNYYNYVSEARVSSLAAIISMTNGYANTVQAYQQAIRDNPGNPSLYLNLAQFQASQNKLADALQTVGAALQVKNNYIDAIYLLSQIEAAQGNLKDAITAAQVAVQINPQSSLLFFQLGVLEYSNADYTDAVTALEKAVSFQDDYANARYFLGLSYARLGRTNDALSQFSRLAASNPGNTTVESVLRALQTGVSPFAAASSATASPVKGSALPVKGSVLPVKERTQ